MKTKFALLIMLLLLAMPFTFAQELTAAPGVTPDSPLWGLDKAIERLSLAFTSDISQRAEKRLANANERLAEVKAMVEADKIAPAERAEVARQEEVADLEKEVDNNAGIPSDIKAKVLENLQKHVTILQGIQAKLSERNVTASGISTAISKSSEAVTRFQNKPTKNQTGGY